MAIHDTLPSVCAPRCHQLTEDTAEQAGRAAASLGFAHTFGFLHALLKKPLGCVYTPLSRSYKPANGRLKHTDLTLCC